MSFLLVALIGSAAEVTDVLTSADFSATNTSYKPFSGVKSTSNAVYAGETAKSQESGIQFRDKNKREGIVTTTSGGKLVKIVVTWSSNTMNGTVDAVQIFGKNATYTSAADLFNSGNEGSMLKEIPYSATNKTVEFIVNDNFEYVGFRTKNGAMVLESIEITWSDGAAATEVYAPKFTPIAGTYEGPQNITIESATPDAVITYTINDGQEQTYTAPIALTEVGNYTIKAKATDPTGKLAPSAEVVAEYVINLPVCEAPTFGLKEGTYYEAQNVVISSLTEGASITYSVTKNDAEFVASTTAVAPVTVELPMDAAVANYVITAKASKEGMTESAEVSATYTLNPNKPAARMFIMVNDASELAAGDKVIFVAQQVKDGGYQGDVAMGGFSEKYGMVEHVTVVEGDVVGHGPFKGVIHGENTMNVHVFEVGGDVSGYTFQDEADQTYISSTNSNGLYWTSTVSNEEKWTLSNLTEGVTLENVAHTGRILKYNPNSPRFATYTKGQEDVLIFKHSVELSGVESNVAEEAAVINTVAGGVVVAVSEPTIASVYTVSGQLVANQVVDATSAISLANGFYIVKVGNTVKKVIVR